MLARPSDLFDARALSQVALRVGRVPAASFRMKTYAPRPQDIERRWYVVDADGVVLGRLASEVASILRGKHKPIYAPHADTGDHVIVVNAKGEIGRASCRERVALGVAAVR